MWPGGFVDGADAGVVTGEGPLDGFGEVVPGVPRVCNLDCLRRGGRGCLGVGGGPAAADDLELRMALEPSGDGRGLPPGQDVASRATSSGGSRPVGQSLCDPCRQLVKDRGVQGVRAGLPRYLFGDGYLPVGEYGVMDLLAVLL